MQEIQWLQLYFSFLSLFSKLSLYEVAPIHSHESHNLQAPTTWNHYLKIDLYCWKVSFTPNLRVVPVLVSIEDIPVVDTVVEVVEEVEQRMAPSRNFLWSVQKGSSYCLHQVEKQSLGIAADLHSILGEWVVVDRQTGFVVVHILAE